jgi:hypothetical protein
VTKVRSSAFCWFPVEKRVQVDVGHQVVAHVSGIQRCGSPWACPTCAPVVRERRALDIDVGLRMLLETGGGAVLVSLTTRHHRGDRLAARLDVVSAALKRCLRGNAWERRRRALGYVGAIKAVEVTWGEANGWHPHAHAVLCFERPLTSAEIDDLEQWLFARWAGVLEREGLGSITRAHGVDVRAVTSAGELSSYLTKVEGGWGVGLELARSDLKAARRDGSLNPVGILRSFVETGEKKWLTLWQEFEAATFGKRAVVWSPGLRDRLLGDDQEQTDVEAAASEGADITRLRWFIEARPWMAHIRAGTTGELLSDIEAEALALFIEAAADGRELAPLDVCLPGNKQPAGSRAKSEASLDAAESGRSHHRERPPTSEGGLVSISACTNRRSPCGACASCLAPGRIEGVANAVHQRRGPNVERRRAARAPAPTSASGRGRRPPAKPS